jgi:hypothetical protein
MSPFGKLIRRVHRVLVLLVMSAHGRWVILKGMCRHALIDFFLIVGDFDFARELDVVVLLGYISLSFKSIVGGKTRLTANSSLARNLNAGTYLPIKSSAPRIKHVPTKEYAPPVNESASW